jgi:hypothetical protein
MSRVFDWRPRFDERSRNFRAISAPERSRRTRTWTCLQTLDQKAEGACVGFAVSHEAAATPAAVSGVTARTARAVYKRAQLLDEWPGESYEGTSVLAGMKAGQERGWWGGYRWAFGEDDLALAVGYLGPVVLGVNWYTGMQTPDAGGQIYVRGRLSGGHAILCLGYDAKRDRYLLHNSWGPRWGINGRCYLSAKDMARLLREQGEAAIPMRRRAVREAA